MPSRAVALAVLLTLAPAAWAQAARTEGAADAAMERAKRAAAGPLKAIQQASKIRRRLAETDAVAPAVAAPASPAAAAAVTPRPATVLAAAAAATPPAAAALPAPERAAERAEAPAVAGVPEAEARVPSLVTVAAIEAQAVAPAGVALPAIAVTPPPLSTLPPKVLSMVGPDIPPRLMEQGPRAAEVEVEVELSLRADGSVAEVSLLSPVPRAWQRYITMALEQWRFEAPGAALVHRVRLVFGAPS